MRRGVRAAVRRSVAALLPVVAAGAVLSACTGDDSNASAAPNRVVVTASWNPADSAPEMKNFLAVLDAFTDETGIPVEYAPPKDRDAFSTNLDDAIAAGRPPDVALLPQPGLLTRYAQCSGVLVPLPDDVQKTVRRNYNQDWQDLGSVDNTLYGVVFKAANKSMIWYKPRAFTTAKITLPTTWPEFLQTARALDNYGLVPVAIAGANQWVLTDWFENIYLRQAGVEKYQQLAKHEIKWTDPSVKAALTTLLQLWGKRDYLAGDPSRMTLQDSVDEVFGAGNAAMVFEGDFLAGLVAPFINGESKFGEDASFFDFPSVNGSGRSVVVGGDTAVMTRNTTGAAKLMQFLASPRAAEIWASAGGLVSPNKSLSLEVYPDQISRRSAEQLQSPTTVAFDLSDQLAPQLGSVEGQGLRAAMATLLANPNPAAITQTMNLLELKVSSATSQTCPGR